MSAPASAAGVLRPGDQVRFDGAEHTVVGLAGTTVRLAGEDGVSRVITVSHLQAADDFLVLSGTVPLSLTAVGLLDAVSQSALARARWWERHVVEVEAGLPPPHRTRREHRPGRHRPCPRRPAHPG